MAVGVKQAKGHKKFSVVTVIFILIPLVLAYAGYVYIPAWWADGDVNEVLRKWANSAYNEKDTGVLREGIERDLGKLGLEFAPEQLEITFQEPDKDYIWITFQYDLELNLPGLNRTTMTHWDHAVETDLSRFVW